MSVSTSPRITQSSKASRRANSCKPCRDSKSKCSGGIPCTTCQKKRRKPRCYYLNSISQEVGSEEPIQGASAQMNRQKRPSTSTDTEAVDGREHIVAHNDVVVVGPHEDFYGTFSLARSVEEFKQLLSSDGQFQEIIDSVQPIQVFDLESQRSSTAINTSSAQFDPARDEFSSQLSPALQHLVAKYHAVRSLLNTGFATQAWSAFASLVRDSELFGLKEHADPGGPWDDLIDPEPCRQLWWLLIELDTQLSFLLGRCPCIDPSHGVPKPTAQKLSYGGKDNQTEDVLDFTEYMMSFMTQVHRDQRDRQTLWEDKSTTLQSDLSRLQRLQSKLPPLPEAGADDAESSAVAQHHVDVQCALMVLYCQMLRSSLPENEKLGRLRSQRKPAIKSYYKELLKTLRAVIENFDYSYRLDPTMTASSWPRCFGVFSAATMLGIARLQQEADVESDKDRIHRALRIFIGVSDAGQAPGVAQLAAENLAEIHQGITEWKQQPSGSSGVIAPPHMLSERTASSDDNTQSLGHHGPNSGPKVRADGLALKRSNTSSFDRDSRATKRMKSEEDSGAYESSIGMATWESDPQHQYTQVMPFDNPSSLSRQESAATQGFEQQPYPQSATSSFNDQTEFYEAGYIPTHSDGSVEYHPGYHWLHPPYVYRPPMYDDWLQSQFQASDNITSDVNSMQMLHRPPLALQTDQTHTQVDAARGGQHHGFVQMHQTSPTHVQGMMAMHAQDVHSVGSTPNTAHPSRIPPEVHFYSTQRALARPGHTLSSPGGAAGHIEGDFNQTPAPDRRRSLADLRQQQLGTWTIGTPPNFNQQMAGATKRGVGQERPQSPRRADVQLPTTDQDFHLQGDAVTMQQLQSQQRRASAPRRLSTTQMETSGSRAQLEQFVQQNWQLEQQVQQSQNDMRFHEPYTLTMTSDGIARFNQQLQYRPNVAVMTGPFADGQGHHWGWTG